MRIQLNLLVSILMYLQFSGNAFGTDRAQNGKGKTKSIGSSSDEPAKILYCPYRPQVRNTTVSNTPNLLLGCVANEELIAPGTYYIKIVGVSSISIEYKDYPKTILLFENNRIAPDTWGRSFSEDYQDNKSPLTQGPTLTTAANMALNQIFSTVADMAVTRAKNLALDLATDKVKKACKQLNTIIPALCRKFSDVPLLDLIRDRKMLTEAVVSDALTYLGKFQSDPSHFQFVINILRNHLLQTSTTSSNDSKDAPYDLVPHLHVLVGLFNTIPPVDCAEANVECKRLNAVLALGKSLLMEASKVGFEKAKIARLLQWSVFRELSEPNVLDKVYLSEYNELITHAANLINNICQSESTCKLKLALSLSNCNFTLDKFASNHPDLLSQKKIWKQISGQFVIKSDIERAMFNSWFIRFRALMAENDSRILARSALVLFMDVLAEIQKNKNNVKKVAELEATKQLVLAIIEKDHAGILRAFIDLLQYVKVGDSKAVQNGMVTLRLIISLIEKDADGEKPEDAQKRRVKLLEEFADRMTNRKNRTGQGIVSAGVSAMLGFGYNWQKPDDDGLSKWNPVLSIPLGVSYEYYWTKNCGIHAMVYPLDVAQYARFQTNDKSTPVPEPSFYTALTFGLQIAYTWLARDTPVTLGIDGRYIPALEYTLDEGTAKETKTHARHFQVMVFLGFHFPLFDFN